MNASESNTTLITPVDDRVLRQMVRVDQLVTVRRNLLVTVPANIVLSIAGAAVAVNSGYVRGGVQWTVSPKRAAPAVPAAVAPPPAAK